MGVKGEAKREDYCELHIVVIVANTNTMPLKYYNHIYFHDIANIICTAGL